jgi:hypothetical protein
MYAGGISYVSSCSFGFIGRVSAEPVAIAVRETSKIEKMLDIVENFIAWESLEYLERLSARDS